MRSDASNTTDEPGGIYDQRRLRRRRLRIAVLALLTTLLFALLFVQSAFNTLTWLRPRSVSETFSLYVLSTINLLAFIILLMVLVRNIIKLRRERRERRLGARFKTRLVIFFISLSLLPVTFLFFATTGLINRSIDKWFSLPGDEILKNAISMERRYLRDEIEGNGALAQTLARLVIRQPAGTGLADEVESHQLALARVLDEEGSLVLEERRKDGLPLPPSLTGQLPLISRELRTNGVYRGEITEPRERTIYLVNGTVLPETTPRRFLLIARRLPTDLSTNLILIREEERRYEALKANNKLYRSTMLQTLALMTLLVLFIAFWMAINVSRSIAEPVQRLAEATARIRRGELDYHATVVGDDELATLARSFNEMTTELAENRRRLQQSADDLQVINRQLLERRQYIETILQSLSAGVISLDETGNITTINGAALALLEIDPGQANDQLTGRSLELLLPEQQREELRRLILLAARYRSVTREVHFTLANQVKLDAAVTVTARLDGEGEVRGVVIVIEDLSELIDAQRRAAWSEVARRMAHEIRNPLTPIRLSAERLARNLLGDTQSEPTGAGRLTERQVRMVRECTAMIGTEVATLQRMVEEFSTFARLPKIHLEPTSLNEVVTKALRLYDGRLAHIQLECHLDPQLPSILLDGEQMRQVLVNLLDNALEFVALSTDEQRLLISTRVIAERKIIELLVSDTGPGIPVEHRERIFEPYFSTRKRGTGLGLAIVSRIVAEHHGRIRVLENRPHGAAFLIELPLIATDRH
ncbi:MAG: hypothetical protein RIR86_2323 [Acidobacteriota bacterium]